jgi:hypothetical protein
MRNNAARALASRSLYECQSLCSSPSSKFIFLVSPSSSKRKFGFLACKRFIFTCWSILVIHIRTKYPTINYTLFINDQFVVHLRATNERCAFTGSWFLLCFLNTERECRGQSRKRPPKDNTALQSKRPLGCSRYLMIIYNSREKGGYVVLFHCAGSALPRLL